VRAFATDCGVVRDDIDVKVTLRTGDRAILIGAAAIIWYERAVADDADLISSRVSAYRQHLPGRLVTDAVILATALHLAEALSPEWDLYHVAMRWLRRQVAE
jgi:hypothetical protein